MYFLNLSTFIVCGNLLHYLFLVFPIVYYIYSLLKDWIPVTLLVVLFPGCMPCVEAVVRLVWLCYCGSISLPRSAVSSVWPDRQQPIRTQPQGFSHWPWSSCLAEVQVMGRIWGGFYMTGLCVCLCLSYNHMEELLCPFAIVCLPFLSIALFYHFCRTTLTPPPFSYLL